MHATARIGRLLGMFTQTRMRGAHMQTFAQRHSMAARRFLIILTVLTVVCRPSHARTVPVHLPFESVMRDVQLRYKYFHSGTLTWPGCCFGSGSSSPGAYPADGYYGDYVSRACAVRMTQSLVDGLRAAVSSPGVWLREDCWNIEGTAPQDVNDPNSGPVFHFLTAEDLRIPSSVTVDVTNYMYWFSVVQSGVQKLSHTYQNVGQSNIAGAHGVGSSNNQADCPTARTAAKGLAESDWNANNWGDEVIAGFVMWETLGTAETGPGVWKADAQLINNRGKLTVNLSSQPADLVSGCTTTIYLALGHYQDGESNYPPVGTDRKFHLYDTHSGLSDYESTMLAGTRTVLTIPCEANCTTPPDTGFLVCKEKGWFRIGQVAILALEFDHDPSTSTSCTGQRPAIPPIRTTTGSSTAGNHGDKGKADPGVGSESCSGESGVRAGPSTSNSPGGRDGGGAGGSGKRPEGGRPVDLATGAKIERSLDMSVQLPGTVFQVYRGYCSDPVLDEGNGLMGARWSLSIFTRLQVGSTNIELVGSTLKDNLVFAPTSSGHWSASGPTTQELTSTTATISGDTVNVYRLTEPGHWYMDFFRDAGIKQGLLAQEVDVYGNKQTYAYTAYVDSTNNSIDTPRLTAIYLNGQSASDCVAEVLLDWILPALEGDPAVPSTSLGKLASIASYRFDAQRHPILLKGVTYLYKADGDDLNGDLETADDLIQVTSSERVDSSPFLPFYTTVTQYRYHTTSLTHSSGNERIDLVGGNHQLKHVIQPEQIEYVAQLLNVGNTPASDTAVTGTAATLLTLADTGTVLTGTSYIDLPAKIVGYSSNKVSVQYLQTACGCSGATQGTRESYSYFSSSTLPSTKVTEAVWEGSAFSDYRINYYDMKVFSGVPYLFTYAVQDANDSSKLWAWHYVYDSTSQNLIKMMQPSARDSYTPASTSAASYSEKTDTGLVHGWAYTSDNRLTESRLAKGNVSTDPSISGFTILSKTTYQTGSGARPWLPAQLDVYRTDSGSTSADDLETTTFSYGFHSGDAIAWIKTSVEKETVAENGPGSGTYDSFELFDTKGQNTWDCSKDLTLTRRVFDASTGAIASITRNASSSELGSSYAGQSTSGWGPAATSDGSLTTTYTNDLLGRTTSRTSPGAVVSYTRRVMKEDLDNDRKGVLMYSEVSLPFQLPGTTTFDGPVSVTWYNAAGRSVRTSGYLVDGSADYAPLSDIYTLPTEIAKSTTHHHLSGLVQHRRAWQDVTEVRPIPCSTISYTYDAMGRVKTITSPTGTISENTTFDVLGRVLKVRVGTNASGSSSDDMAVVAKYFFDSGGAESQGVGDGRLTCQSDYTGEYDSSDTDGTHRLTKRTFDFRGRLIKVQRPTAPHEYLECDNLDRVVKRGLYSSVPSGIGGTTDSTRGLYSESRYSQRGLLYKQRVAINATDISGSTPSTNGFLESNSWFDAEGRTIAEWAPNAPATKCTFDAHDRTKVVYVTDRKDDNAPGSSGNYAHAAAHDDDSVLEQTEYTYGGSSSAWPDRLTLVKTQRRNHDADTYTSKRYGTLDADNSVATYVAYYYDIALRRTHTVDFGTNSSTGSTNDLFKNGSAPTWPPSPLSPPSFTGDAIVSAVEYNARGLVARSIDPKQHATEYRYDDLSRRYAVIENAQGTTGSLSITWPSTSGTQWAVLGLDSDHLDQNRVTSFVFDEAGNVVKQIAHTSNSTSQVTLYSYSTTKASYSSDTNSLIGTKSLLGKVTYPSESDGQPGTGTTYEVTYAYNGQGELRSVVDQNNTKHTYSRDVVGRVLTDLATVPTSGSNIDARIKRIGVSYDDFGRLSTVKSYDHATNNSVVNAVEFGYTKLWQVEKVYQNVAFDVRESNGDLKSTTKSVQYAYTNSAAPSSGTSAANYSRLTSMTYPSSNQITYGYGSGVDDRINRLTSITPGTDSDAIVEYSRLGLDMFAVVDYPLADVQLDRTFSRDGKRRASGFNTQDKGVYPGWDRHGRVAIQAWLDGNLTAVTSGAGSGYPSRPPLFDEGYSYDAASNRTGKDDMRPGVKWTNPDSRYSYDGLHRLSEAKKHLRTASTFEAQKGSQRWELDVLGNWTKFQKELNGFTSGSGSPYTNSDETENRTYNQANEILNRYPLGTGNPPTLPFTYDHAGNLREEQFNSTTSHVFTHDAWNRLVKHVYGGTLIPEDTIEYEYNGLHWRTIFRHPPSEISEEPSGGTLRSMYYSAAWQLVEEQIDYDYLSGVTTDRVEQEVWGIRYIDDPVMRLNGTSISSATKYYHLTDVQFSTVAMTGIGADPEIKERIRYDAYGTATHRFGYDVNDDGPVNSLDSTALNALNGKHIYESTYDVAMDLNRDGVIGKLDDALLSGAGTIAALGAGEISDRSSTGPDNVFGYDGYVFAPELQRYCVRFRWYDTATGRWMERDPLAIDIGSSRSYEYVADSPLDWVDPLGLFQQPASQLKKQPPAKPNDGVAPDGSKRCIVLYIDESIKRDQNGGSKVNFDQIVKELQKLIDGCKLKEPVCVQWKWYDGKTEPANLGMNKTEADAKTGQKASWVYNHRFKIDTKTKKGYLGYMETKGAGTTMIWWGAFQAYLTKNGLGDAQDLDPQTLNDLLWPQYAHELLWLGLFPKKTDTGPPGDIRSGKALQGKCTVPNDVCEKIAEAFGTTVVKPPPPK